PPREHHLGSMALFMRWRSPTGSMPSKPALCTDLRGNNSSFRRGVCRLPRFHARFTGGRSACEPLAWSACRLAVQLVRVLSVAAVRRNMDHLSKSTGGFASDPVRVFAVGIYIHHLRVRKLGDPIQGVLSRSVVRLYGNHRDPQLTHDHHGVGLTNRPAPALLDGPEQRLGDLQMGLGTVLRVSGELVLAAGIMS